MLESFREQYRPNSTPNFGGDEVGQKLACFWECKIKQAVIVLNLVSCTLVQAPARIGLGNIPFAACIEASIDTLVLRHIQKPLAALGVPWRSLAYAFDSNHSKNLRQ